ncbi:MAG: 2-hydroxyacyl-CoA dehydratase family protein [Bacillota bacterium]|nr:2-hydroxyacyl-CoA dehydratase family protein [Bacillota bacterium]
MVLVSCSYVPLEIPLALGIPAKRAVFREPGASCEAYLPRDFCPYAKAFAREHGQDCVVAIAGSCDAMRRAYDALRYFGLAREVHFVDVPRSCGGGAEAYYAGVLRDFALELAHAVRRERGDAGASAHDVDGPLFQRRLVAVMQSMNSLRQGLSRLFELVAEGRISAMDAIGTALRVNDALGTRPQGDRDTPSDVPADAGEVRARGGDESGGFSGAAAVLEGAMRLAGPCGPGADGSGGSGQSRSGDRPGGRAWVGVSGTCLLEPALLGVLEEVGLAVAFVDSCLGPRSFDFRVPTDEGVGQAEGDPRTDAGADENAAAGVNSSVIPGGSLDPFYALAHAYLGKPACPRMFVGDMRAQHLRELVRSCGVHGIVYFAPKFCDHAYYDFAELKRHVGENEGLPMLLLEGEYGSARSGQTLTRVTAFREMLEGRLGLG